jgi:hypothetical protein
MGKSSVLGLILVGGACLSLLNVIIFSILWLVKGSRLNKVDNLSWE